MAITLPGHLHLFQKIVFLNDLLLLAYKWYSIKQRHWLLILKHRVDLPVLHGRDRETHRLLETPRGQAGDTQFAGLVEPLVGDDAMLCRSSAGRESGVRRVGRTRSGRMRRNAKGAFPPQSREIRHPNVVTLDCDMTPKVEIVRRLKSSDRNQNDAGRWPGVLQGRISRDPRGPIGRYCDGLELPQKERHPRRPVAQVP